MELAFLIISMKNKGTHFTDSETIISFIIL